MVRLASNPDLQQYMGKNHLIKLRPVIVKRHSHLLLALAGTFLLSACGGGSSAPAGPPAPPPPPPPPPPPVNSAPVAANVAITDANGGAAVVADTLIGSYDYGDDDGDAEGGTVVRWLRDGTPIPFAETASYLVTPDDVGAQLAFEVTPIAMSGTSLGITVLSASILIENSKPTASGVSVTDLNGDDAMNGDELAGSYTFNDVDGDTEGSSTYRWLRNGVAIPGATGGNYTLVAEDVPALIAFEVTPVAASGTSPGDAVSSPELATTPHDVTDATLSALIAGNLVLVPDFDPDVLNYAASAPFHTLAADVVPTTNNPAATFQINGGSNSSVAIPLGQSDISIEITAEDGVTVQTYTVSVTRTMFEQKAYVKASNTQAVDWFGDDSVSLSFDGKTMAVGATGESGSSTGVNGDQASNTRFGSGAVYVFVHEGGGWTQQAYIKASNTDSDDRFGGVTTLSADGNTLAVAAHREDSAAAGVDADQSNSGSVNGAVYVFVRDENGDWAQQAYIKASNTNAGDSFGIDLAISGDGNTLAVSTDFEDSNATGVNGNQGNNSAANSGAVYVYTRDGNDTWAFQAYIKASNTEANDRFGGAISLAADGNTLAVGAIAEDSAAVGANGNQADNSLNAPGAVYVFRRAAGVWSQQVYLKASNPDSEDSFGIDVALDGDGDTLAVGARLEDSNATGVNGDDADNSLNATGAVYVFTSDTGGTWTQQAYIKAQVVDSMDWFGERIAISDDGNLLAVSATGEDSAATGIDGDPTSNDLGGSGAAYLFTRDGGGNWSQEFFVKSSAGDEDDAFGKGIALSGDGGTLAIEAFVEDSSATGINGDDTDNSAVNSGAAYIFQ